MEEVKVRELPEKESIDITDYLVVEDYDGTKKTLVRNFRSLVLNTLYFNSIIELKSSPDRALKEGDVCETLGYYEAGDGGGGKYRITYNPAAVEDGMYIHYLSYSDTLRAELIVEEKINVNQFGAKGDGRHDDTEAINAAVSNRYDSIVEFVHGDTYITRQPIRIDFDNVVIEGNGATLFPHYINGFEIEPEYEDSNHIQNVTINNLIINCERASAGVSATRVEKLNLNNLTLKEISNTGIQLDSVSNANIVDSSFDGDGFHIIFNGRSGVTPTPACHPVNVVNCKFGEFRKAIYVLTGSTSGIGHVINIVNCMYKSTVANCCCIDIAAVIENMTLTNNSVLASAKFLRFGSVGAGSISCTNLSCIQTSKIFDILTSTGILILNGSMITGPKESTSVFENMAGKVQSNIMWEYTASGATFDVAPTGSICDLVDVEHYSEGTGYSISGGTITIRECRNLMIDWNSSTSNITDIVGGANGQLIYIKSSTNKSLIAKANTIVLSGTSLPLSSYNGILLRYNGTKWVQMTSMNNTIINSKSTYDIWLDVGNTGTPQDFLNSITGANVTNISARSVANSNQIEFVFSFTDGSSKSAIATIPA